LFKLFLNAAPGRLAPELCRPKLAGRKIEPGGAQNARFQRHGTQIMIAAGIQLVGGERRAGTENPHQGAPDEFSRLWSLLLVADGDFPAGREQEVMELAYALEMNSQHPIARAVTRHGRTHAVRELPLEEFASITGQGLRGRHDGASVLLGRRELLEETGYAGGEWELLGGMEPDTGRLGNRIWTCVAKGVRPVAGHAPEEGISVLTWSLEELAQAMVDGRFSHALHVAVVMMAVY